MGGSAEVSVYGTGRQRKYVYGRTRAEVAEKLQALKGSLGEGLPVMDERVTVAKFLQIWLDEVVKPSRGYATWQGYEVNVLRHIVPVIGKRTLAKLSPADIQALVNIKREEGLAPRTVQYVMPPSEPPWGSQRGGAWFPGTSPRWSHRFP